MKTVILPDIHHKTSLADKIVESERPDRVVCVGDYFDEFGDGATAAEMTAQWVKEKLALGWELCIGNHDAAYMWRAFAKTHSNPFMCSGYTPKKAETINNVLSKADWLKMRMWACESKYVISHAGFNQRFVHPVYGLSEGWLRQTHDRVRHETFVEGSPWNILTYVSNLRGGLDSYSGILWQDWREFTPINGVHQIVGHTKDKEVRYKAALNSHNVCIDTGMRHYLVIENKALRECSAPTA